MKRFRKIFMFCTVAVLVLSGAILDGVDAFLGWSDAFESLSLEQWQDWYAVTAEAQLIGFAMVAFLACPYARVEIKAVSFFIVLWRVFVAVINWINAPIFLSPLFLFSMGCFYLAWMAKAVFMGRYESNPETGGAYYFYMPIHSAWGLLKSVFVPWEMARYESVVVVEGQTMWAVNRGRFVMRSVSETNLENRQGVKVYLGRGLTAHERLSLNFMVGKKAIPGVRDCRRLRVV